MKEKIELGQSREFGDLISDTLLFFRQNFKPLLKAYFSICGFFMVAGAAAAVMYYTHGTPLNSISSPVFDNGASLHSLYYVLNLLFGLISSSAVTITALSYVALYKENGNEAPTVEKVWGYFKYFFFRVLVANLLISVFVVLGFLFCFFPGVYLAPVCALMVPIMIVENTSFSYAFNKAFSLIKGNWWETLGVLLIMVILVFFVCLVLVLPPLIILGGGEWLTGLASNNTESIVFAIATQLCQVFYLIPIISTALIYFSLSEDKRGTSLLDRIQSFGKKDNSGDHLPTEEY